MKITISYKSPKMLLTSHKCKIWTFPWSCLPMPMKPVGTLPWLLRPLGWCSLRFNFPQAFGEYQTPHLIMCQEKRGFKKLGGTATAINRLKKKKIPAVKLQRPPLSMTSLSFPLCIQYCVFGSYFVDGTYTKRLHFKDTLFRGAEFLRSPPHWAAGTSSHFPWKAGSPKCLFPVGL